MTKRKTPPYWHEAVNHLSQNDPVLGGIIKQYKGETLVTRGDAFYTLVRSIISQQISVSAADAIWTRLESMVGTIEPNNVMKGPDNDLRACGLSRQKVHYLRNLSEFFMSRKDIETSWDMMSDEEVIADLTTVKGIGRWTAEMFLIFHLLRPDVFPMADLGLQNAIKRHYEDIDSNSKHAAFNTVSSAWKPYRTVATWYLWRSLDPVAVEY